MNVARHTERSVHHLAMTSNLPACLPLGAHPAADAEEPGDHPGHDPDERGLDHPTSRLTATTTRKSAKPIEIVGTGTRCCSAVPATTPPSAGMPISRASSGCRFP